MNYEHKQINGVEIIELKDSIDLYSAPIIKKFIKSLLKSPETKIILTFETVSFIDSSGLGMIINYFFECEKKGIPIKIAEMSQESKRIFNLTKMSENINIYETLEDALGSFR